MTRAVEYILDSTVSRRRQPLEEMYMTFKLRHGKAGQSTHGKSIHATGTKYPLRHLSLVCQQALCWAVVTHRNQIFWQCQGGAIGSPLSPPWLVASVMLKEHEWLLGLQQPNLAHNTRIQHGLWDVIRYVDNRLVLTFSSGSKTFASESLRDPAFYGGQLTLEPEPTTEIVGIDMIHLAQRVALLHEKGNVVECRSKVIGYDKTHFPWNELWRYRTAYSAGSDRLNLSSFQTRIHQAIDLSFPEHRKQEAIARTLWVYRALEFNPCDLVEIVLKKRRLLKDTPADWWKNLCKAVLEAPQMLHQFTGDG